MSSQHSSAVSGKPSEPVQRPITGVAQTSKKSKELRAQQLMLRALRIQKSLTTSDPFESKEPIDKLTDKDSLKNISIKRSTAKDNPEAATISTVKAVEPVKVANIQQRDLVKHSVNPATAQPAIHQAGEPAILPSLPKISTNATVQKKIENYFVPQGRTTRSISSSSSVLPSGSFTTEPYKLADSSDLDIITAL
ncbi:hypothetical protein PGTUg99_005131 [Puccinia graminis f. sp. tritici]|uniref:Uncharacterized protein n=1 Tax=Puccinia graminis f. sp. tritici TaxID=56615 RepID=A0A5B0RBS0_PUCGR|nr:hypothetical protein PGTUg99_005131 [Puccinia graminis f. sp. tritici]